MDTVGMALFYIGNIGTLICFIIVLIKMFQNGATGIGIACLLLCWCVGPLIAYIMAWVKGSEWGTRNIAIAWTVCWVLMIAGGIMAQAALQSQFNTQFPNQQVPVMPR